MNIKIQTELKIYILQHQSRKPCKHCGFKIQGMCLFNTIEIKILKILLDSCIK